jgi:hypothetical protein
MLNPILIGSAARAGTAALSVNKRLPANRPARRTCFVRDFQSIVSAPSVFMFGGLIGRL